jgi:hypothetical protein
MKNSFKGPKPPNAFKAPGPMKPTLPKEPAKENADIYAAPKNDVAGNEIHALKHELQHRHMSMYANPSEKLTPVATPAPTDSYFTKLRDLLRVRYGNGNKR